MPSRCFRPHTRRNKSDSDGAFDLRSRQIGERRRHHRHHGGAVLGVGRDSQAHRIDTEIADRRPQPLLDRPVAVGLWRVQPGELGLLGMFGSEFGVGDATAHGIERLGQGLGPGLVPQPLPDIAQWTDDLGLPGVAYLQDRAQPVGRQRRAARGAQPAAEQQYVYVAAAALLEVEAGLGHPLAAIDFQREIPERMGEKIGHSGGAWVLPFGRAKGYTAQSDVTSPLGTSAPSMNDTTSDSLDAGAVEAKLEALRSEHRDLDEVVDRLLATPPFDQLQLQRLKKRKLGLKDQILRLESQLIPDIIA